MNALFLVTMVSEGIFALGFITVWRFSKRD